MHGNDAFSKKVYSRDFVWLSSWGRAGPAASMNRKQKKQLKPASKGEGELSGSVLASSQETNSSSNTTSFESSNTHKESSATTLSTSATDQGQDKENEAPAGSKKCALVEDDKDTDSPTPRNSKRVRGQSSDSFNLRTFLMDEKKVRDDEQKRRVEFEAEMLKRLDNANEGYQRTAANTEAFQGKFLDILQTIALARQKN
jgi:hypothetical protein